MGSALTDPPEPSGCADPRGPQFGPQYWGIKEAGWARPGGDEVVGPNEKPYLDRVRRATVRPYFMAADNDEQLMHSPEVWLARKGAGAKAHADGHCESTITIQLSGTKRWRLAPMFPKTLARCAPSMRTPTETRTKRTGRGDGGDPLGGATRRRGARLRALGDPRVVNTDEVCAASITYQLTRRSPQSTGTISSRPSAAPSTSTSAGGGSASCTRSSFAVRRRRRCATAASCPRRCPRSPKPSLRNATPTATGACGLEEMPGGEEGRGRQSPAPGGGRAIVACAR